MEQFNQNSESSRESSAFQFYQEDFGFTLDELKDKKILDMPSGSDASFVKYCLKQGIDIIGMDGRELSDIPEDSEIKKHFVQGYAQDMPFKKESFDLILIRAMPVGAYWKIFQESLPLLKGGGILKWAPLFPETNSQHKAFLDRIISSQKEFGYSAEMSLVTIQKGKSGEFLRYCLTVRRQP